jgi:hypothetical protein
MEEAGARRGLARRRFGGHAAYGDSGGTAAVRLAEVSVRVAKFATPAVPGPVLNAMEQDVLAARGDKMLAGQEIADRCGYPPTSGHGRGQEA